MLYETIILFSVLGVMSGLLAAALIWPIIKLAFRPFIWLRRGLKEKKQYIEPVIYKKASYDGELPQNPYYTLEPPKDNKESYNIPKTPKRTLQERKEVPDYVYDSPKKNYI